PLENCFSFCDRASGVAGDHNHVIIKESTPTVGNTPSYPGSPSGVCFKIMKNSFSLNKFLDSINVNNARIYSAITPLAGDNFSQSDRWPSDYFAASGNSINAFLS